MWMGGEGEWVEELLEHLQFSTALPFGYAAFFGLEKPGHDIFSGPIGTRPEL